MQSPYRKFLWIWGTCTLTFVVVVAGVNVLMDPFGAYPRVSLKDFEPYRNHAKTRIAKAEMIARDECEVLILGSSRAEVGFSPANPAFRTSRVYNVALGGTNFSETRHVFEFAIRHNHVRRILLSLDLLMFSAARMPNEYFTNSRFNPNLDMLEYRLKTLVGWHAATGSIELFDAWRHDKWIPPPGHGFVVKTILTGQCQRALFEKRILGFLNDPETFGAYTYSPERVEMFRRVVRKCRERGIDLVTVIPPVHALDLETIRVSGQWSTFEQWKRDLVRVLAEESVTGDMPLWDFTGYESYMVEPVPPATDCTTRMRWYFESSHFTPALGDLALYRIFGQALPDGTIAPGFGVKLTPANIARELARVRQDRERYARNYPDEITWIESLVTKARATSEPPGMIE